MVSGSIASVIPWECDRSATVCVLGNPPDDSDTHQNLRITVIYYAFLNKLPFIKF